MTDGSASSEEVKIRYSVVPSIVASTLGTEHVRSLQVGILLKITEHLSQSTSHRNAALVYKRCRQQSCRFCAYFAVKLPPIGLAVF